MLNPESSKVWQIQPVGGVSKHAAFIVDIDDVEFRDLKADDLATWKTNGTIQHIFGFNPLVPLWLVLNKRDQKITPMSWQGDTIVMGFNQLFCCVKWLILKVCFI